MCPCIQVVISIPDSCSTPCLLNVSLNSREFSIQSCLLYYRELTPSKFASAQAEGDIAFQTNTLIPGLVIRHDQGLQAAVENQLCFFAGLASGMCILQGLLMGGPYVTC